MFWLFRRLMQAHVRHRLQHHRLQHHRWRRALLATAACGACVASVAHAHPPHAGWGPHGQGPGPMHERAAVWLDGLLDEIGATPQQKATAHAARDEALAALHKGHASRRAELDAALQLFKAERIDDKALTDLRQRVQANHAAVQQVVAAGVVKLHGQLDAGQRQKLVAALREFRPEARGGMHAAMAKRMVAGRVAQLLDEVHADDRQRAAVHAAADAAQQAMVAQTATHQALFDEAIGLLAQARIEPEKLHALLQRHDASREVMADAVVVAVRQLHDALRADQRAAVAAAVQARLERFQRP